jgi:chemotaxis protein CheX
MKSASAASTATGSHENWIPLIEVAAKEVFELMLGCQLALAANPERTSLDITAMVGLTGQLCGMLSVACDRKAAALMTSKMLGVELEKVGPEVSDALGEVCNMVAGNFKNKIAGLAGGCMLSPPTVVSGGDYSLHSMADAPALEVKMLFEGLPMVIALQINR